MFGQKNKNKCSQLIEGDGIESRLPFKIFSTLIQVMEKMGYKTCKISEWVSLASKITFFQRVSPLNRYYQKEGKLK